MQSYFRQSKGEGEVKARSVSSGGLIASRRTLLVGGMAPTLIACELCRCGFSMFGLFRSLTPGRAVFLHHVVSIALLLFSSCYADVLSLTLYLRVHFGLREFLFPFRCIHRMLDLIIIPYKIHV